LESRIDRKITHPPISSPCVPLGGDRESLNNVFGSQRQRLFYAALRLLGNNEDAEDAVQEGVLAALRNLHRFEGRAQLSTWLTRIVVNAALMRLRTRNAHEFDPIDEPVTRQGGVRLSDLLVDGRPNPEEVCVRTEERRIMKQGLKSLSRSQRRALSLHDFEGMTTKEAARALGLCEGTVKSQVHRARQRLSQHVRRVQLAPV
jgi:RNA polymerase sigma-70 factor, ECF subfamily